MGVPASVRTVAGSMPWGHRRELGSPEAGSAGRDRGRNQEDRCDHSTGSQRIHRIWRFGPILERSLPGRSGTSTRIPIARTRPRHFAMAIGRASSQASNLLDNTAIPSGCRVQMGPYGGAIVPPRRVFEVHREDRQRTARLARLRGARSCVVVRVGYRDDMAFEPRVNGQRRRGRPSPTAARLQRAAGGVEARFPTLSVGRDGVGGGEALLLVESDA